MVQIKTGELCSHKLMNLAQDKQNELLKSQSPPEGPKGGCRATESPPG